ncbi:MAG: glycosyltransferase family 4 protein, partial [Clostridia bacterium]|nr:glycosyltransferase family 4 protein [Clostridia bacterium]
HAHRDKKWADGQVCEYKKVKLNSKKVFVKFTKGDIIPLLKAEKFDVVILGHYLSFTAKDAIKYCKKHGVKIGVSADGAIVKKEKKLISFVKTFLLKKMDFALSPSKQTDEYFIKYKIDKQKIFRYNFTSLLQDDILDFIKRQNKKQVTVLTIGQFIYRKGFDVLIKAANQINGKIQICGAEPTQEYLDLVKEQKATNVEFLGFKTKQELKEVYLNCDIFVLPTREDIWGLVINEAMNYSLPIITTSACVAGVELLDGNCIIEANSCDMLVNAINDLVVNHEKRLLLGKRNNQKIKTHTIENMASRTIEILNNL